MYINLVHLNSQDQHEETYAEIIVFTIFITNRMKIYMYTHNRRGANAHVTIAT